MNKVFLTGNLTKNPELRYSTTSEPIAICRFSIAVNDGYGDKKKTYFIPIVTFGKKAEVCEQFLAKGSRVAITGKLVTGSYEKDGHKVYTTDVNADDVEFITTNAKEECKDEVKSNFAPLSNDDLPF